MIAKELRQKFIDFFEEKGHKQISSASLIPENDPTVLFTTAGMHPLVPYLLGEKHPLGKRLVDVQKCLRTDDIDEVGDNFHHTFFEMLGNWSFGDYFKKEAIAWSFEFLTDKKWLGLPIEKLAFTVFEGDADAPFDQEAYDFWVELGVKPERIAKLPKKDNWWGPAGATGPCGPDTEMFYWTGEGEAPVNFQESHSNPLWVEIWNDVFMQYDKNIEGKYNSLAQKNVDTGMGVERTLTVLSGLSDDYKTELFLPIIEEIEKLSGKEYEQNQKEFRVIADHIKAAVFAINDGAIPSNKGAGYIVRRLIRRAIVKGNQLEIKDNLTSQIAKKVFEIYGDVYKLDQQLINAELLKEENKFRRTLKAGIARLDSLGKDIDGKALFDLLQSYGLPLELSLELARERGVEISESTIEQFRSLLKQHQELSRTASAGMFRGGLADAGEETVKLHTAAHLLLESLRRVLGDHVFQKGSNITPERLRFDFSHGEKMTPEQIKEVEEMVNEQIEKDLPVSMEEMNLEEAKKAGAMGVFESKYGEKVKVYTIGEGDQYFSREICGGPHVTRTGELGHFKIKKEESSSGGVRRIKAILE